jgi:hypothetical protein
MLSRQSKLVVLSFAVCFSTMTDMIDGHHLHFDVHLVDCPIIPNANSIISL